MINIFGFDNYNVTIRHLSKHGKEFCRQDVTDHGDCVVTSSTSTGMDNSKTFTFSKCFYGKSGRGYGYEDITFYDRYGRLRVDIQTRFKSIANHAFNKLILLKEYSEYRHLKFINILKCYSDYFIEPIVETICKDKDGIIAVYTNNDSYEMIYRDEYKVLMYCAEKRLYLLSDVENESYYDRGSFRTREDMIKRFKLSSFMFDNSKHQLGIYNAVLMHQPAYIKEAMLTIKG